MPWVWWAEGQGRDRERGESGGTSPTWAQPPPDEGGTLWQVTRWEGRAEWGARRPWCEGTTSQTRAEMRPPLGSGPCFPGDGAGARAQGVG